ncbi:MAG: shikimate dehydrogenase [Bauldia sp.]|nr:shikimate dehydrogenase [Bauldia sp.]
MKPATAATTSLRQAGVIGWPVAHSRSPTIHRYWLRKHGLAGSYDPIPVEPERIAGFLRSFASSGFVGANVTIPHKEAALAAVAHATPAASAIGAVNTLWLEDGRLHGANTDAEGFLANLDQIAPGWDGAGGPAVVLGAGGAARAIIVALRGRGVLPIAVVNRTRERAASLAERFGDHITAHDWSELPALLGTARLLVNTTSLGMAGQPPLAIDLRPLPAGALVTDIVYTPLETPLLASARARGLRTVDGLGMLLHQAVPGFELWFGVRPEVTPELRAAVVATLGAHK